MQYCDEVILTNFETYINKCWTETIWNELTMIMQNLYCYCNLLSNINSDAYEILRLYTK